MDIVENWICLKCGTGYDSAPNPESPGDTVCPACRPDLFEEVQEDE